MVNTSPKNVTITRTWLVNILTGLSALATFHFVQACKEGTTKQADNWQNMREEINNMIETIKRN